MKILGHTGGCFFHQNWFTTFEKETPVKKEIPFKKEKPCEKETHFEKETPFENISNLSLS